MKSKTIFLPLAMAVVLIAACKKEPAAPTVFPDYSNLAVGNYWIYQQFEVDEAGNAVPKNVFDSAYVEKDTLINSETYFKVFRKNPYSMKPDYSYLRDSLHYLVDAAGTIHFSSQDFETTFRSYAILAVPPDTIARVSLKMADKDLSVETPAGTFITSNFQETFIIYPNWVHGVNPRTINIRYAENVGIVVERLPFFLSNPKYLEKRLIRYHVN